MNDSDEALVLRSQRFDRTAFEELVRRSARGIYARLYLICGNRHQAEDLVQETYLRAWRNVGQLKQPATFRSWLWTIAASVAIDAGRRKARYDGNVKCDADLENHAAATLDPAESAQISERRRIVLAMLSELPPEYRDALSLRYIAGSDYQTIGRQLGISNGSLRGLLGRGLAMLRKKLTDIHADV